MTCQNRIHRKWLTYLL